MMFTPERLLGIAMLCFARDRIITVFCNSPLHPTEVAIVELVSSKESFEGAICLHQLMQFAAMMNLRVQDVYVREQGAHKIELWLFNRDAERKFNVDFDDDPTPVEHSVDIKDRSDVQASR